MCVGEPAAGPAACPGSRSAGCPAGGLASLLGDLAVVDQALHEGMVDGARHQLGAAKVVDARVAGVRDVAFSVGSTRKAASVLCGSSSAVMAVSLIIRCDSITIWLQQLAGVVLGRQSNARRSGVAVSITWSAALRPPLLPPMPSASTASAQPGDAACGNDCDLVLLVGAVAAVQPVAAPSECRGRLL